MILNLTLKYDGKKWIAKNDNFLFVGKTLEELDESVKVELKKRLKSGETIEVRMEFDYKDFPFWITQYHPYYFRRVIRL